MRPISIAMPEWHRPSALPTTAQSENLDCNFWPLSCLFSQGFQVTSVTSPITDLLHSSVDAPTILLDLRGLLPTFLGGCVDP